MKKNRYTEEQIVGILKKSEAGLATPDLCRKHGISQQTLYRWKAKYGGLEVSDAQRNLPPTQNPVCDYLAAVLPGLANSSIHRLPELTPTAWAASNL